MQPVFTGMSSDRCLLTLLFDLAALLCLSSRGLGFCYFLQLGGMERGQLFGPEGAAHSEVRCLHPCVYIRVPGNLG